MKKIIFALTILLSVAGTSANAQSPCASLLTDEYVSNGQYYTTAINFNETKDCEMTLIEGNEYRMIVCPRKSTRAQMQLVDKDGNILFDNRNFSYTNYWNFQIKETISCKVKLSLVDNDVETDEIILLVGFKK